MSEEIVKEIIENRLADNWILTEISYDGIKYIPKRGTAFIKPMISENQPEIRGFYCTKRFYSLIIEVRVPKNTGTEFINSYCDELKNLFGRYETGQFYCREGYVERIGNSKNQWFQKNVMFECTYKEID